jgi:hypothetical protein
MARAMVALILLVISAVCIMIEGVITLFWRLFVRPIFTRISRAWSFLNDFAFGAN